MTGNPHLRAISLLFATFIASPVFAATYYWSPGSSFNTAGNGTWSTTVTNWSTDGSSFVVWPNNTTDDAVFGGTDGTYAITIGNNFSVRSISFTTGGYTLSAAASRTITIGANIDSLSVSSGKTATIGSNVTLTAGSNVGITGGGNLVLQSGGRINITNSASLVIKNNTNITIDGGTISTGSFSLGDTGTTASTLTIKNGGTLTTSTTSGLRLKNGSNVVNLDGGTITTALVTHVSDTSSTFNFNGGTLKVASNVNTANTFLSVTSAYVKEGGAVIDTNSYDIFITQGLLHGGSAAKDGGLTKNSTGTLTLNGVNTYTGDTLVNSGTLLLADNASMTFVIGANGINNQISGTGAITLNGDFSFDLSNAGTTAGNMWQIVNVATLAESFGSTFSIIGFTQSNDVWTATVSGVDYEFRESTGMLSVVPEPSTSILIALCGGLLLCFRRRHSSVAP